MPHSPSSSATPSPHTGPTCLPPTARRSRAAAAGLHLVFDAAGDRQHLHAGMHADAGAGSPSSCSDASFSSASSTGPATPRSRACSPALAHAEDDDCWNLIPYHVPWGNEYYDYIPGMLPGPDGQCFFYRSPTPLKYKRTMRACTKCRDRKAKCSGEKPACARCVNRGYPCHYDPEEPKRPKGPELARQRLREKGAGSPAPPRASPALAAPSPRVVPKHEELELLADFGGLAYPLPEADTEVWGAPQGVLEASALASPPYALQGAIDPQRLVHPKSSPESPSLLLNHEPALVVPSHNVPSDYWSYSTGSDMHHHHHHHHHPNVGMAHYHASVHAPRPVKQVPPFLSAPRYDEPPPEAPPPIVIPQPPILQAALMAVPEPARVPVPAHAPEPVWPHEAQAAYVAYSAQELINDYPTYDYAPAAGVYAHDYASSQEYAHQAYYDIQMYGQDVGVAPAATYLASVPAASYVSYAV